MKIEGRYLYYGDDLSDAFSIREKVFQIEQKVPKEIEIDNMDDESIHVVVYVDNTAVSTGRLFISENKFKLGRIAVLKEQRGNHLGDFLTRMLIDKAFLMGAKEVVLGAQMNVKGFYEKLGFVSFGNIYYEANIEHIKMKITRDNLCRECTSIKS